MSTHQETPPSDLCSGPSSNPSRRLIGSTRQGWPGNRHVAPHTRCDSLTDSPPAATWHPRSVAWNSYNLLILEDTEITESTRRRISEALEQLHKLLLPPGLLLSQDIDEWVAPQLGLSRGQLLTLLIMLHRSGHVRLELLRGGLALQVGHEPTWKPQHRMPWAAVAEMVTQW